MVHLGDSLSVRRLATLRLPACMTLPVLAPRILRCREVEDMMEHKRFTPCPLVASRLRERPSSHSRNNPGRDSDRPRNF